MGTQMDQGYVIAKKRDDGGMGQPIGNDEGAIMLFDDLEVAKRVRNEMQVESGPLSIFAANLVFCGEVVV